MKLLMILAMLICTNLYSSDKQEAFLYTFGEDLPDASKIYILGLAGHYYEINILHHSDLCPCSN